MVSDQATTEPAPEPRPGPTGIPSRLRPLDEVGDDQEVARIFHRLDDAELEVQPRAIVLLLETRRQPERRRAGASSPSSAWRRSSRASSRSAASASAAVAAKRGRIGCTTRGRVRQRSAISTVFSSASGRSLKRRIISARLAK